MAKKACESAGKAFYKALTKHEMKEDKAKRKSKKRKK